MSHSPNGSMANREYELHDSESLSLFLSLSVLLRGLYCLKVKAAHARVVLAKVLRKLLNSPSLKIYKLSTLEAPVPSLMLFRIFWYGLL
jgi:hypothetical protein